MLFAGLHLNADAEEDVPVDSRPGPSVYKAVSHGNHRCFEKVLSMDEYKTNVMQSFTCILPTTEDACKLTWLVLG